jgi:hypothetical protein
MLSKYVSYPMEMQRTLIAADCTIFAIKKQMEKDYDTANDWFKISRELIRINELERDNHE